MARNLLGVYKARKYGTGECVIRIPSKDGGKYFAVFETDDGYTLERKEFVNTQEENKIIVGS